MYQHFFGLTELPFELTSNPRFLFFTAQHREALSHLEYGLLSGKAVTLLLGAAGTGKTTLLRSVLESERCSNVSCVVLHNPALTRQEFVEILARQFGLGERAHESKAALLKELEDVVRERRYRGEITALIVDEAQSLSLDLLEEIRLLANMETPEHKLLPLVLTGQPEFAARLNLPELRQLKQRVALRCEVVPFTLQETAAYISHRVAVAGGDAHRLFTREALILIQEHSLGIPRTINVISDNALLNAFALGRPRVEREIVLEVCRDLDLRRQGATRPPLRGRSDEPTAEPAGSAPPPAAVSTPASPVQGPAATDATPRRRTVFGL
jgi:general secretion pathway protein A